MVGPLASYSEPHSYDLCEEHAVRLTVPRGWEVVRHAGEFADAQASEDDLTALAEAVREAGRPDRPAAQDDAEEAVAGGMTGGRRGHLRVLPAPSQD